MTHTLTISEEQRQLLLMALAHLSIERPGFDMALSEIAGPIDNRNAADRPELYDRFRELHAKAVRRQSDPSRPWEAPPHLQELLKKPFTCDACGRPLQDHDDSMTCPPAEPRA